MNTVCHGIAVGEDKMFRRCCIDSRLEGLYTVGETGISRVWGSSGERGGGPVTGEEPCGVVH